MTQDNDVQRLENLKEMHARRLHELRLQEAMKGASTPPEVTIEIEDITSKIENIDTQLRVPQRLAERPRRRRLINDHLEEFITFYLKRQIQNHLRFTAYDITLALLRRLPGRDIDHEDVRTIVHLKMNLILELGLYKREVVEFDAGIARQYIPVEGATQS